MSALDAEIDALYALPLSEFTTARNALSKSLKGADGATVKALQKPTVVPYAVNQLYWHERRAYDRVMQAGQALRHAQLGALSGKPADVGAAQAAHRQALAEAAKAATAAAEERGVKPTLEPLTRMLEALSLRPELPAPAGRLVDLVQPAGFEAFAAIAAALPAPAALHEKPRHADTPRKASKADADAEKRRHAEEAAAARAAAEAAVQRAQKEREQALTGEQRAQALVDLVQQQLDSANRALGDATAVVTRAQRAVQDAETALARLSRSNRDR